ncbi:hypothetical protein Tco_0957197 [Tanacetum coccineum]
MSVGQQDLQPGGRIFSRAAERSSVESFYWTLRSRSLLELCLAVGLRSSSYLHYNLISGLGSLDNQISSTRDASALDPDTRFFYVQAISSIPAIVDRYMDNKLGEAIHKAIQSHNAECREEAQAEKQEYIDLVDSSQNVIESLEAVVLSKSSSQPKSTYEAAASLSEYELTKILLDKMEESKSHLRADYKKKLYMMHQSSLITLIKNSFNTYGGSYATLKKKESETIKIEDYKPAFNLLKGTCKSLTELEYHFEECSKATTERLNWHNPEGKPYPFNLRKPLPLIPDHREHQSDTYVITMKMKILPVSTSNSTTVDSILQAGNPVKEILLNLNLPDHRSILTDLKIHIKMEWRYLVPAAAQDKSRFIATCSYSTDIC